MVQDTKQTPAVDTVWAKDIHRDEWPTFLYLMQWLIPDNSTDEL